jgi:5-methylcytosine-specific restriction endonuclease McrA
MQRESWHRNYYDPDYLTARQEAIERTKGRCTDCGKICAWYDGTRWRTAGMGGEVDHVTALCDGGTNDPANLELRCKSCHGKHDSKRRHDAR